MRGKKIAFESSVTVEKKLDSLGRVTVPKPLVRGYQWLPKDEVIFVPLDDNTLQAYSLRLSSDRLMNDFKGYSFLSATFDELGRLVIPIEYRRQWGIADKTKKNYVTVAPGEHCVILGTATKCCFCGTRQNLVFNKGRNGVCIDCGGLIAVAMNQDEVMLDDSSSYEDCSI